MSEEITCKACGEAVVMEEGKCPKCGAEEKKKRTVQLQGYTLEVEEDDAAAMAATMVVPGRPA